MRYQIICTTRKENNSIDKLGFIEAGGDENQAQDIKDKEHINRLINEGNSFFFTNEDGQEVEVISVEDDHVRTKPDGTEKNNLLHLRECRYA
ncbi:DUF3892 domain-containing protein [Candidatus Woesearchaeota archaeon]|nr:DUF3892 domain-containing protein [Candidatus Woesearchaeota archaeon]